MQQSKHKWKLMNWKRRSCIRQTNRVEREKMKRITTTTTKNQRRMNRLWSSLFLELRIFFYSVYFSCFFEPIVIIEAHDLSILLTTCFSIRPFSTFLFSFWSTKQFNSLDSSIIFHRLKCINADNRLLIVTFLIFRLWLLLLHHLYESLWPNFPFDFLIKAIIFHVINKCALELPYARLYF